LNDQGKQKDTIAHPGHREGLREQLLGDANSLEIVDSGSPFGVQFIGEDVVRLVKLLRDAAAALPSGAGGSAPQTPTQSVGSINTVGPLPLPIGGSAPPQEAEGGEDPQIDCPLCGETVRQVASVTLSLALSQHCHWKCQGSKEMMRLREQVATAEKGIPLLASLFKLQAENERLKNENADHQSMRLAHHVQDKRLGICADEHGHFHNVHAEQAEAERDALKVKRDVALRAWKGAAADRDKAQRQVAELKAEVASLKVENERLKQSAVEVAKLNQPNLEQIMALSVEVESLKAKLAAPSKP
jgi:hypothetical protein